VNKKLIYLIIGTAVLGLLGLGIFFLVSDSGGTASDGSKPSSVITPAVFNEEFPLEVIEPAVLDLVVKKSQINIRGRTRPDALVTVNDYVLEPDIEGYFQQAVDLAPGLNIIEVIASIASGEQGLLVLAVGYFPE
jgi:hypothetical protein